MRSSLLAVVVVACACRRGQASIPPGSATEVATHGTASGAPAHVSGGHEGDHGPAPGHVHQGGPHRFADAGAWAQVFDAPERDAWQRPDEVVAWMRLAEDAVVADIGAGTGYFALRFARALPRGRVLASDIESSMVEHMRARAEKEGIANLVAVQGSPEDAGLDARVDVAFMCDVAHHIDDRVAYFQRLAGALEAGGRVVIVDFRKDAAADAPGPPAHMRIAAQDLIAELERAGYRLTRREDALLAHQYLLEFAAPP